MRANARFCGTTFLLATLLLSPTIGQVRPESPQRALVKQYCLTCHSDQAKTGGLTLEQLDIDHPEQPVTLIRHAYVRTSAQGKGIGTELLQHLRTLTKRPVLIGTWADASWAIGFYMRHGFEIVSIEEKDRLLRTYWNISDRQMETSVVLADTTW